ncbi:MAG: flavin reductase family protein [Planctomycetaceae bacterium]|nr:flavin reductase family protein [Planctomycetaceae bacterium]MCP4772909.1 flavin reductase family protein [Planctomycetaceae bacterium]
MLIDPAAESASFVYSTMIRAITPRPIAWVSTISPTGVTNLAPFSYFNGICSSPAALMFSPVNRPDGSPKDTLVNIRDNGEFVVNVVPFSIAQPMFETAGDFQYETSEFSEVGLTPAPSKKVQPPGVQESPIQFECEVIQIVPVGEGPLAANVIIGKIVLMNIADNILDKDQKIDQAKLDTIGRMGGRSYSRTTDRFELKPTESTKK